MEDLKAEVFEEPFPYMIIYNFYNEEELKLIWEELNFYTKPKKLLPAKDYGGIEDATNAKAISLDSIYYNHRDLSNILTVNRKLFNKDVLNAIQGMGGEFTIAPYVNYDVTKVRYYYDQEYYDPHTDKSFHFLGFSYFYKEPKKFDGGELFFPDHNLCLNCENNSMIIFPGWVKHGVKKVSINNSNYFDGYGRYAITSFFGCKTKQDLENR
jgi:hypothetical protein|tara:strand:- start:5830 stop:6462 length:633 start_codon:yes stop_codon:yes gene_type:complete